MTIKSSNMIVNVIKISQKAIKNDQEQKGENDFSFF